LSALSWSLCAIPTICSMDRLREVDREQTQLPIYKYFSHRYFQKNHPQLRLNIMIGFNYQAQEDLSKQTIKANELLNAWLATKQFFLLIFTIGLNSLEQPKVKKNVAFSYLSDIQVIGEGLHIVQPMVHLTFLGIYGSKSWKPWLASATCDLGR